MNPSTSHPPRRIGNYGADSLLPVVQGLAQGLAREALKILLREVWRPRPLTLARATQGLSDICPEPARCSWT